MGVFDDIGGFFTDVWTHIKDPFGVIEWLVEQLVDIPEIPETDKVYNTVAEGVFVSRAYGKCKLGGNKIRFNDPDANDLRIIIAHCRGEINSFVTTYINDIEWADLKSTPSKTEYTGTRTQTADARFAADASAYRSIAYTAFTFGKGDKAAKEIGHNPNITVVAETLLCPPLAGGADAFTRNPAVVLYDWYLNVEGYSAGDLDVLAFQSLEELCDEVPPGGTLPRYRFDHNFARNMAINDAKKFIWSSFNGRVIMSQGKLKPVWDSAQMADGAGSLTVKTVSHAFDEDDIVKETLSWSQLERSNVVRVHYRDSEKEYKNSSVEDKDEYDIDDVGEILAEDKTWFITDAELARRRAKYKFNKFKYEDYSAKFSSFSGGGDLEAYDLVTVTHSLPGWTNKPFYVVDKGEDQYGRMKFTLRAYYSGVYDDAEVGEQPDYGSVLPNPYTPPTDSTSIAATLVATGTAFNYDSVQVSFAPPADYPFYSYSEIHASNDDSTYYMVGQSSGEDFVFNGMGSIYQPGETVYIKLRNVNELGIPGDMPGAFQASVVITGYIRFGSYYVGPNDIWGGNAAIGNVATVIVMGNLDGTPKIALGPTADAITFAGVQTGFFVDGNGNLRAGGTQSLKWNPSTSRLTIGEWIISPSGIADNFTENDATIFIDKTNALMRLGATSGNYITLDGGNLRIRSSNYVSGIAGAGFTLDSDLFEVGNIAARGIIRTAVFQADVVSAVGGNLMVRPADVLDVDMTAADASTLTIEGNESFAVSDILRIKTGLDDEWLLVTNIGSAPTYTVTRDQAGAYGADANPAWEKGATVVNYGASGEGGVYLTASETNAPYVSIFDHAGSPWSALTTRMRMGNLNGFLGYSTDLYGIAIGETNAYLKYDPTNGLRIKGLVEIVGDPALQNMLMNAGFEETDGTNAYYWTSGSGYTTETSGGDGSNKYYKLVRSGSDKYAYHLNPDQSTRLFEVNEGEVYEFGGSCRSDGVCTYHIGLGAYDKDGVWISNSSPLNGTDAAWTTRSGIYIIPADIKFLNFKCYALTADGWAAFDNVYLKRVDEKAWSFTHASDRTTIDGGNIYASSITLASAAGDFDMDSISEGSSYGRVATTSISGGQIILTTGVTGSLPVANSDADITSDQFTNTLATIDSQVDAVELGLDSSGVLITKAVPASVAAPGGAGLFLGSDYMGYYSGSAWTAYIQNDGSVKFGSGTEYFQYTVAGGVLISTSKTAAITILGGGDITLTGSDTDPGKIIFNGTSYTVEMGGDADGDRFTIVPDTTDVVDFFIGGPPFFQTDIYFKRVYLSSVQGTYISANYSTTYDAGLECTATGTTVTVVLGGHIGGAKRSVAFNYVSGASDFSPVADGQTDLGKDAYRWATVFCDDLAVTGYDTGWINRSDWTNVHMGSNTSKDVDSNVAHALNAPLSDLLVKVLISTDGTDNNSFEMIMAGDSGTNMNLGITIYQVDVNNIQVQTGAGGFYYMNASGTRWQVDTEDWYYKIRVFKIGG